MCGLECPNAWVQLILNIFGIIGSLFVFLKWIIPFVKSKINKLFIRSFPDNVKIYVYGNKKIDPKWNTPDGVFSKGFFRVSINNVSYGFLPKYSIITNEETGKTGFYRIKKYSVVCQIEDSLIELLFSSEDKNELEEFKSIKIAHYELSILRRFILWIYI